MNYMLIFQYMAFPNYLEATFEQSALSEATERVNAHPERGIAMLVSGTCEEGFETVATFIPRVEFDVNFPHQKS